MKTLNTVNQGLNKIDAIIATQTTNKANGIKVAIRDIDEQLQAVGVYGMNDRKSRKLVKKQIMDELSGETNKSVLRAYAIAFTIEFRGLAINIDLLSVAQIENLANHGDAKKINALYELDATQYETSVKEYLRGLKTRVVSVKTFEKKAK